MSETKQLILIRHGETDWNITGRRNSFTDISMNEQGTKEVTQLAEYIKRSFPDAKFWCSPAKRAQETAAILTHALNTDFQTMPEAGEINFGPFEGRTLEELGIEPEATQYQAWENGARVEGAEALEDAASRAKRVFDEIVNHNHANQSILVSHGAFIRVLICVTAIYAPPTAYPNLKLDNASVSVLQITEKRVRLSQLNNRCYLLHRQAS